MTKSSNLLDLRDLVFDCLLDFFSNNSEAILLSVDMGANRLKLFRKEYPTRFLNVGVSEQNAVSMAAGLSATGFLPFVYGLTPFLVSRARAQLRHDIAIGNRQICIIGSGVGLTYAEDGPSHHSLDDLAILRGLPSFSVNTPICSQNILDAFEQLIEKREGKRSVFIRVDKCGGFENIDKQVEYNESTLGLLRYKSPTPADKCIITSTPSLYHELKAKCGPYCDIAFIYRIDKFSENSILALTSKYIEIDVVDESSYFGGFVSLVKSNCHGNVRRVNVHCLDSTPVQEKWSRDDLRKAYGLVYPPQFDTN